MTQTKRKERGILFNSEMVRAIMEGRKTQTRRPALVGWDHRLADRWCYDAGDDTWSPWQNDRELIPARSIRSPFGKPGDLLYVRESWRVESALDDIKPTDIGSEYSVDYEAGPKSEWMHPAFRGKLRPSLLMPKRFARTWLEVTKVRVERVERVQEISEEDALAEGCSHLEEPTDLSARSAFNRGWSAIYEPQGFGWDANPWVWVYDFKVIER